MSSPAVSSDADDASSGSVNNNIAFLVHSPHTVTEKLPPDVDNKSYARQKRRRTRYALIV
jgi:hypothetical protein